MVGLAGALARRARGAGALSKKKEKASTGRRFWFGMAALILVAVFLGYNMEVHQAGAGARVCLLEEGSWVVVESLSPRYGEVGAGELVLVRTRHGDSRVALARVLAAEQDEVTWYEGQLWVNEDPVVVQGRPVQPVGRLAQQTRGVIVQARKSVNPGAKRNQWRGFAQRQEGPRKAPGSLGLPRARFKVPRQHVYVVMGAGDGGWAGQVTPLGDITGAALVRWPGTVASP